MRVGRTGETCFIDWPTKLVLANWVHRSQNYRPCSSGLPMGPMQRISGVAILCVMIGGSVRADDAQKIEGRCTERQTNRSAGVPAERVTLGRTANLRSWSGTGRCQEEQSVGCHLGVNPARSSMPNCFSMAATSSTVFSKPSSPKRRCSSFSNCSPNSLTSLVPTTL